MDIKEAFELHDTLNPKLWDGETLKPEVEDALTKIVSEYVSTSEILTDNDIIDAELVGSNVSYNYTDKSDLDLHLVVNMEELSCDPELVQIACNAERSTFNKNYNLSVKGVQVELYVEDVKASTASNGIYSLFKNEWVKFPQKIDTIDYSTDQNFIEELNEIRSRIESILSSSASAMEIQDEINNLYNTRRESIMTEGEYGFGNQLFKEIRNLGLLGALKDKKYELASKELSVESKQLGEGKMKKTYRVNYLLREDFHYSYMEADDPMAAAETVYNYFDEPDDYEFLGVEEVPAGPVEGPNAGISSLIISAINDEWNTISFYNDLSITARGEGREDIASVIDDIMKEENKHVGQLQEILKTISPATSEIESGEVEGQEQLEEN